MTARQQGSAIGALALAAGMVAGTIAVGVQAQGQAPASRTTGAVRTAAVARTPDGHPDFQGVWANNTVTPLQRPKQWEDKKTLTDAEIANLQKFAARITENDGDAQFGDGFVLAVLNQIEKPKSYDPGTGNYNQFWSSSATGTTAGPRSSSIRRTASYRR